MLRVLICGLIGLGLLSGAQAGGGKPPVSFRIHSQTNGEGLSKNQAMPVVLDDPPETIQVNTLPDLSERDLVAVQARETQAGRQMWVKFNAHGTVVLNAVTTQSMGRIFVVFLNQKQIFAPVIDQRIGSGELLIPYAVSDAEIKALEEAIKKNAK
jgi:preprotein translocase subunit SecD